MARPMPEPTIPVNVRLSVGVFEAMEKQRGELSRQKFVAAAVANAVMTNRPERVREMQVSPETPLAPREPIKTPEQASSVAAALQPRRPFTGPITKADTAARKGTK